MQDHKARAARAGVGREGGGGRAGSGREAWPRWERARRWGGATRGVREQGEGEPPAPRAGLATQWSEA